MNHFFFYIALSLILMHEMDAIRCKEWRIFPGLSYLNDRWGMIVFIFAHIPLYALLLGGLIGQENPLPLMRGLDIFFIIHLILHILFLMHPKNAFTDWISWSIIIGAALAGGLDLCFH